MKRRLFAVLSLVLILSSALALPVCAVDAPTTITTAVMPRYVNISLFSASIDINSSGKASCYSFVETANSSYVISFDMCLQRYKNGTWTTVKTWSTSDVGNAELDKALYVTSGYYYRTAATATVRTSSGSFVESQTIYSLNKYY